jgi:hypothetical protein
MAVRRPLKLNGSDLKEMSDSDIDDVQNRMIYLYGQNPSVTLVVVSTDGNLGPIVDTRLEAGDPNLSGGGVDPVSIKSISYSRVHQLVDSGASYWPDSDNISYPTFLDSDNNIKAMTPTDFYDTFTKPSIDKLVQSTYTNEEQAGTYFVSTSRNVPNSTLVSLLPIFTDTIADAEEFMAGTMPEVRDQPLTVNNYYLHMVDPKPKTSSNGVKIDDTNNLQEYPDSDFNAMMQRAIRYTAAHLTDNLVRYDWDSGNPRTTAIIDTILDSDNAVLRGGNNDEYDYVSQLVPAGDASVRNTYNLRIRKT